MNILGFWSEYFGKQVLETKTKCYLFFRSLVRSTFRFASLSFSISFPPHPLPFYFFSPSIFLFVTQLIFVTQPQSISLSTPLLREQCIADLHTTVFKVSQCPFLSSIVIVHLLYRIWLLFCYGFNG
jgi:hypothetical protein